MLRPFGISFLVLMLACLGSLARANHQVLLQGQGRLAIVDPDGTISWEMPWRDIHDIHVLENGNILTRQGPAAVVEIDRDQKKSCGDTIRVSKTEMPGRTSKCTPSSGYPMDRR